MNLDGKAVLVTGASKGLGQALVQQLLDRGARVVGVARDPSGIPKGAHALAGDVGQKDAPHRIVGAAAALVGPIDVLVNNASTLGPVPLRALLDTECEDFEQVLQTNLLGPFRL